MKAYWVNAEKRTIEEVEYAGLKDLQRMVGGYVEIAYMWPGTRDVLFVDEEGSLKTTDYGFALPLQRPDQAFSGNGVLVGREIDGTADTVDPHISIDTLRGLVQFGGRVIAFR